jgi:hypothetical protein
MPSFCHLLGSPLLACLLLAPSTGRADSTPDPLRLVPKDADFIVEVPKARRLVETFTNLDLVKQLRQFDIVREYYDSTNARRFFQLVAYYEKELGMNWPELLDRLAGGGAVVAARIGSDPAPALLVVQSRDEKLLHRFAETALNLLEQELARQESKEMPRKASYRQIDTVHVGKEFHAALVGSALVFTNQEPVLRQAIDRHLDGGKDSLAGSPGIEQAHRLLPTGPLVSAWLNLAKVKQFPQAKDIFKLPRDDAIQTVGAGGILDMVGRSPFVCAGFYGDPDGLTATIRLPRGLDGMSPALTTHVPPEGAVGSLPLLEPKGVLFSESFWLDVGKFWDNRKQLFNAKQVKTFEDFDKSSGKFLAGSRFSQLVTYAGPYHRLVAVNQSTSVYHTAPKSRIPAFAYVLSLREPARFNRAVNAILRGAAFLVGFQYRLKLVEEKHGAYTIVGYRFPENAKLPQDTNNLRFNFSPCFVTVGDQFLASSTIELGRQMVDLLQQEKQAGRKGSPDQTQERVYAAGAADALGIFRDQIRTRFVLGQALSPQEARAQAQAALDWVGRLGVLAANVRYGKHHVEYNTRLRFAGNEPAVQSAGKEQRRLRGGRSNP